LILILRGTSVPDITTRIEMVRLENALRCAGEWTAAIGERDQGR